MNAKSTLLLSALCLILPAASASAQNAYREYSPTVNYTAMGGYKPPKAESGTSTQTPEAPIAPQAATAPTPAKAEKPYTPKITASPENTESAEARIWNKYKALAAGKTANDKKTAETTKETPKETTEKTALRPSQIAPAAGQAAIKSWHAPEPQPETAPKTAAASNQQAGGLAAIIGEWRNARDQQREMRTLNFGGPGNGTPAQASPGKQEPAQPEQ